MTLILTYAARLHTLTPPCGSVCIDIGCRFGVGVEAPSPCKRWKPFSAKWCSCSSHPINHLHGSGSLPLSSALWLPWKWRQVAPPFQSSRRSKRRCNKSRSFHAGTTILWASRRCDSPFLLLDHHLHLSKMREIVHLQAGQCGNQIGAKVFFFLCCILLF